MGTLIKFACLSCALYALVFALPTRFPVLTTVAFSPMGIALSWGFLAILVIVGGGAMMLKAK